MFAIYEPRVNQYFCKHENGESKIILFKDAQEAENFRLTFYQNYAIPIAMGDGIGINGTIFSVIESMQSSRVEPFIPTSETKTINFEEIKKEKSNGK